MLTQRSPSQLSGSGEQDMSSAASLSSNKPSASPHWELLSSFTLWGSPLRWLIDGVSASVGAQCYQASCCQTSRGAAGWWDISVIDSTFQRPFEIKHPGDLDRRTIGLNCTWRAQQWDTFWWRNEREGGKLQSWWCWLFKVWIRVQDLHFSF